MIDEAVCRDWEAWKAWAACGGEGRGGPAGARVAGASSRLPFLQGSRSRPGSRGMRSQLELSKRPCSQGPGPCWTQDEAAHPSWVCR